MEMAETIKEKGGVTGEEIRPLVEKNGERL